MNKSDRYWKAFGRKPSRARWTYTRYLVASCIYSRGCQWRMLPSDFPKWRTVYAYFEKWREPAPDGVSVLEQALKKSGWRGPTQTGAERVDAQRVKNTDSTESKGYDAGKKVSGIKRHIAVDTLGLPHAIEVTTADVTDRAGARGDATQRNPAAARHQRSGRWRLCRSAVCSRRQ
ncbi:MAG: transposase [Methylobacter sp.]